MRAEIAKRYKIIKDAQILNFQRYEAFDENTKSEVFLFMPDAGIRADSRRLATMNENIKATFRERDPARFVTPRDFYPITENDPCFYFVEEKPDRELAHAIEETDRS